MIFYCSFVCLSPHEHQRPANNIAGTAGIAPREMKIFCRISIPISVGGPRCGLFGSLIRFLEIFIEGVVYLSQCLCFREIVCKK